MMSKEGYIIRFNMLIVFHIFLQHIKNYKNQ